MRNVLRWGALAILFGLTVEATARAEDWVRYRTPFFSRFREQGELMTRDRDGAHGRPGARYMKWVMNELGMRGPSARADKPAGTARVVTAGASETFGLYESADHEFPRQLEDSLNVLAESEGICPGTPAADVEVLNAALPGMSLPTIEQDVRLRLARLSVDVVLLYPTPAQYLGEGEPSATLPDSSGAGAVIPWSRVLHPRVMSRSREQAKAALPEFAKTWLRKRETERRIRDRPEGWQFAAPPADRLALFERDLRRFIGSVRAIGAIPVLASHANAFGGASADEAERLHIMWERFYPRATGPTIVAFDSLARLAVLRVAADSGIPHADVAGRVRDREAFRDFAHFTDSGAGRAASVMAPAVMQALRSKAGCVPDARTTIRLGGEAAPPAAASRADSR